MHQLHCLDAPYEAAFARRCGFPSLAEALEASEPLWSAAGEVWYITPLPDGLWLAWPYPDLDDTHQFRSYEDTVDFICPDSQLPPERP